MRLYVFLRKAFGPCIEDVILWVSEDGSSATYAIRGAPWRLYRCILAKSPIYQRGHSMEMLAAGSLGVKQHMRGGYPSPQFSGGDSMSIAEFFEMMDGILYAALSDHVEDPGVSLTMLPYPGVPMTLRAEPIPYFSVKEKGGGFFNPKTPRWVGPETLVNIEFQDEMRRTANLCLIARTAAPVPWPLATHAVQSRGRARDTIAIVAHSSDESILSEQAEKGIDVCGGLIYPSLSVGTIPASNFGPISIIFDPRVVLRDLSPFRNQRSQIPPDVILYMSDQWTPNTNEIFSNYAAMTFLELSGNADFSNYYRPEKVLYSLGPMNLARPGAGDSVEVIDTVAAMFREIQNRMRIWKDQGYQSFLKTLESATGHAHYGYLEAKVISVLPLTAASALVAPSHRIGAISSYMSQFGFRGTLIPMELTKEEHDVFYEERGSDFEQDWIRLRYAWKVSRAVVAEGQSIAL